MIRYTAFLLMLLSGLCPLPAMAQQAATGPASTTQLAVTGPASAPVGIQTETGLSVSKSNEIRVTVPGCFAVVVCDGINVKNLDTKNPRDTAVSGFYDLINDPDKKYNYASNYGGLFNHKPTVEPRRDQRKGAFHPGPGKVEVLESNAVRAVVRYSYDALSYGVMDQPKNPDVRFEHIYAIYAPDRIFEEYACIGIGEDVKLSHTNIILHTSHARFAGGGSEGGGKYTIPAPWTFYHDVELPYKGKTYLLHSAADIDTPQEPERPSTPGVVKHADGTESQHKENFLFVLHKATGRYGYRGNLWLGYRSGIVVVDSDRKIPIKKGDRVEWHSALFANHDITTPQKAGLYVTAYRQPGKPQCRTGEAVGSGFDPAMGSYLLKATDKGVDFDLPVAWQWPMFEITNWTGGAPKTITVGDETLRIGRDYVAGADDGKLLLQVRSAVKGGSTIVIQPDGSPEQEGFFARPE